MIGPRTHFSLIFPQPNRKTRVVGFRSGSGGHRRPGFRRGVRIGISTPGPVGAGAPRVAGGVVVRRSCLPRGGRRFSTSKRGSSASARCSSRTRLSGRPSIAGGTLGPPSMPWAPPPRSLWNKRPIGRCREANPLIAAAPVGPVLREQADAVRGFLDLLMEGESFGQKPGNGGPPRLVPGIHPVVQ